MTTNKNVEEEFDEGIGGEINQIISAYHSEYCGDDCDCDKKYKKLKAFVLHAHNEGIKVGLEKAVEVVESKRIEGKVLNQVGKLANNRLVSELSSDLTQLITSNNEVDEK